MTNPIKTTANVGVGANVTYSGASITVAGASAGVKGEYKNLYVTASATGGYGVAGSVEAGYNPTVYQTKSGKVKLGVNVAAGAEVAFGKLNGDKVVTERNRTIDIINNSDDVLTANVIRSDDEPSTVNVLPHNNFALQYNEKTTLDKQLVYNLHAKAGVTATIYDNIKIEAGALLANVRTPQKEQLPAVTTEVNYIDPVDHKKYELKAIDGSVVVGGNNSMVISPYLALRADLGKGFAINLEGSFMETKIGLNYNF